MDLFDSVSPLDYRYYGRNPKARSALQPFLSENARIKFQARVEAALAYAWAQQGVCSKAIADEIKQACEKITADEVYKEEDRIKHDIRALANCIRAKVSNDAKPFVHLGATSFDIVDTANALRFKHAVEQAIMPALMALENALMELALREKQTVQIARTHGQHAEPITFGLAMASYVSRLGNRIKAIGTAKKNLVGKFSGAVGAYNATSLIAKDPLALEKNVMDKLGLQTSVSSTQIVEAEPNMDLMHAIVSCLGVLANLADDLRHLQRSEIAEITEAFEAKQVGSSTMPHKRNPIQFENVKSLWKAFMPRMNTVYLDQLSEHQRDLTNSASSRFLPELLVGLHISAMRLTRAIQRMRVDNANMQKNFEQSKDMLVAEPLYILLAHHSHPNAHETVRQLTLKAQAEQKPVYELIQKEKELQVFLQKFSEKELQLLANPKHYTGIAVPKTKQIVAHWKKELQELL